MSAFSTVPMARRLRTVAAWLTTSGLRVHSASTSAGKKIRIAPSGSTSTATSCEKKWYSVETSRGARSTSWLKRG